MSSKTENRRINIWINGKEVQNNVKSISAAYKKLINEQALMTVGSKEYLAAAKKINQLKGYIDEHKRQIGSIATAWQKAKGTIMASGLGVLGGNVITSLLTRVGGFFGGIMTGAAKMSDQMADIRKTTGMTTEEVEGLSAALSKIDTRTSTSDLREMAIVAGQLGIAKDDILSFVEAVDKTAVALGDEFTGGANEVATVVGKLRNVMGDIKTDNVGQDIMHISNALNELGAAGFATSPVVADFANRIGGVGITLGLTSGQVLGLSATLQELNVSTERGGTAVVKILQKMTTETSSFAAIAGMSVQDYTKLVNTDLYGAFTKVMEGSKKSGSSATALAAIIKDLEIQGAGASEVFAKLGGNVGMLNEKVDLASTSLQNTDSIMNEFNLKNENLAGQWEKTKKVFNGIVMSIGKSLAPAILSIVKGFTNMLEWIKRNADSLRVFLKVLLLGTAAIIAYNVAAKASLLIKKMLKKTTDDETTSTVRLSITQRIAAAATYLYTAAIALLSGNLKKATIAMRAFSIVTKMSPIGLLVGLVTAVSGAFLFFSRRVKEADIAVESNIRVQKRAKEIYGEQIAAISEYRFMLKRAQGNKEEFNKIVKKWNTEIGDKYKASLDASTASLLDIDIAARKATKAIMGMAVVSSISEEIKKLTEENIDAITAFINAEDGLATAQADLTEKQTKLKAIMAKPTNQEEINKAIADVDAAEKRVQEWLKGGHSQAQRDLTKEGYALQRQIEYLLGYQERLKEKVGIDDVPETSTITPDVPTGGTGGSTSSDSDTEKKVNEYLKVYLDIREKIGKVFDDMGIDRLSDEEKELAQVRDKYDEMISISQKARAEIAAKGKKATADELATAKALASQEKDLLMLKEAEQLAITEKYAKLKAEKRAEVEEKIKIALMSSYEKEKYDIIKKYEELIKLAQEYGFDTVELYKKMQEEIEALSKGGKKDVFGMTQKQWEKLKDNVSDVMRLAKALGDIAGAINDIQENKEEKRMQQIEANYAKEGAMLEKQYADKHMNEETFNLKKKQLEDKFNAEKLKIEKAQAKRKKKIAIFEATLDSINNVVEAGIITPLGILMAILGGIQIAAIASEPEPQLYTGGFTKKSTNNMQPAGVVHANEWVSPAWMVNSPVTGPIISQLESIRNSGNANRAPRMPQQARNVAQSDSNGTLERKFDVMIAQNNKLLNYMSDPENRRAIMVHDTFTKYQQDISEMQQLRKIS